MLILNFYELSQKEKFENKDKEKEHGAGFREKEWGEGGGGEFRA